MLKKILKRKNAVLILAILTALVFTGCSEDSVANFPQSTVSISTDAPTSIPTITSPPPTAQDEPVVETADEPSISAAPAAQDASGQLVISYLDVGQADSIFISLPNGQSMLIDAGDTPTSGRIVQDIKDRGGNGTIDYVITTHPHADHIGGMVSVVNSFKINNLWMPDVTQTTKVFENLIDAIDAHNLSIQTAKAGRILFDFGNLKAVFVAPNSNKYSNINNYSAAIMLTYNERHFLFMGDAEKESEAEILASGQKISADVLKVGHHGSNSSSTTAFIKAVSPKYAIISSGKGNSYGHPAALTLATLSSFGAEVHRTDEEGTIIVTSDGENITLESLTTGNQPRAPTVTSASSTTVEQDSSAHNDEQSVTVYVTKSGTKYHLDGCRYLSSSKIPISLEEARKKYQPCSVCHPPQ